MNLTGFFIGIVSFLLIGLYHVVVIKGEYYFGLKIWPIFMILGIIFIGLSILISNLLLSAILAVLGFTNLWTIKELKEQKERVEKGWFPSNPKRK